MRRGLISWSKAELPQSVLDARVARVRAAMAQANIDALALYSDPSRSGGASWLTGFVPYWNRGVVVLPRGGKPVLLTGISNRVHGWIKRNANIDTIAYSTRIGEDAAKLIAQASPHATVAVPDMEGLPGGILDGLSANGATVIDGTALFAKLRTAPDPAELALAFKAAFIAQAALSKASAAETDAATLGGVIEGEARRRGAEEVYVAMATDLAISRALVRLEGTAALGAIFAIRVSVAYKGVWVRMATTLARDAETAATVADAAERFAAAVAALPRTDALEGAAWLIEGCRTTRPLEPLAGTMIEEPAEIVPGSYVSVQATLETPRGPVVLGAPALIGRSGEPSALMAAPPAAG